MEDKFYTKAADYWSKIPATLEGVLGGFGFISTIDINGSKKFLNQLFDLNNPPEKQIALDCGAGIGRITKDLLIDIFDKVEMVEQNASFLEQAEILIENKMKLGQMYPIGLQNFKTDVKYDIIWCQWVLGHLTDKDFIKFFTRCKDSLRENGVIVVKENVTSSGNLELDDIDSSVTRSLSHLLSLLKQSDLTIIKQFKQNDFPVGIYPVYIIALRPNIAVQEHSSVQCDELWQTTNDNTNKIVSKSGSETCNIDETETSLLDAFQCIDIHDKERKIEESNTTKCP